MAFGRQATSHYPKQMLTDIYVTIIMALAGDDSTKT